MLFGILLGQLYQSRFKHLCTLKDTSHHCQVLERLETYIMLQRSYDNGQATRLLSKLRQELRSKLRQELRILCVLLRYAAIMLLLKLQSLYCIVLFSTIAV